MQIVFTSPARLGMENCIPVDKEFKREAVSLSILIQRMNVRKNLLKVLIGYGVHIRAIQLSGKVIRGNGRIMSWKDHKLPLLLCREVMNLFLLFF